METLNTILLHLKFKNIQCTLIYFYLYMWFGMIVAAPGPCLLSLSRQINEPIERVTLALTTRSLSYLFGSGFIFFVEDKIDRHSLLQILIIGAVIGNFCIGISTNLISLCFCMIPVGLMMGVVDVSANSLIFKLHRKEVVDPFIQILHFFFGIGSLVFPFIVGAILDAFNGSCVNAFFTLGAFPIPIIFLLFLFPTPDESSKNFYEEGIYFGHPKSPKHLDKENGTGIPFLSRSSSELVAAFSGLGFLFFQLIAEVSTGSFLSSYAVKTPAISYSEVDASVLVGGYWATYAFSRISAAFLSRFYSSFQILSFNGFIAALFLIIGCVVGAKSSIALWIAILGYGYATGPFFPTMVSYISEHVDMTAEVSSMFIVGGACGEIVGGIGTVYAFEHNYEFLWYFLVIALGGCMFFVIITHTFSIPKLAPPQVPKSIDIEKTDDVELTTIGVASSPTELTTFDLKK